MESHLRALEKWASEQGKVVAELEEIKELLREIKHGKKSFGGEKIRTTITIKGRKDRCRETNLVKGVLRR